MYLHSEIIKQLNAFLKEHKDVSFTSTQLYSIFFGTLANRRYALPCDVTSVTASLNQPENKRRLFMKAEKIKNRYYYQYEEKIALTITGYKKNKNILYFENKENIIFYYDFATQKTNIPDSKESHLTFIDSTIEYIYKWTVENGNFNYSIKEWIFSYPDLWEKNNVTNTLRIQFDCPAGYINFLKTNHLYISQKSYEFFKICLFFPDNKQILAKNWMNVINRIDSIKKDYLFAHSVLFSLIQKMVIIDAKNFEVTFCLLDKIKSIINYCIALKAEENDFNILNPNRGLNYNENSLIEAYKSRADEILATSLQKINGINHYQIADYEIIVPQSIEDLNSESKQQNNCVNYYYNSSIRDGRNYIYFLRKKVNPNKSYMTCRFNVKGKATIEYFYKNNRTVNNKEEIEILKQIDEKIKQILSIK